jgi:DNA-binding beta-propeller fold protein YncE
MSPPINIDGTSITGASIDGQEVQEITINGKVVFRGAGDLNSLNKIRSVSLSSNIEGVAVSKDGTRIYLTNEGANRIDEYELSTPYDISTATNKRTRNTGNEEGAHIELDGNSFIFGDDGNGVATQLFFDTAFNLNSVSTTTSFDASDQIGTSQQAVAMSYDGTKFYTIGRSPARLAQYSLSNPFDISSGSVDATIDLTNLFGFEPGNLAGMDLTTDGYFMYITEGDGSDETFQFELSTPNDFTTATNIATINTPEGNNQRGVTVAGDFLYFGDFDTGEVHQYEFTKFL